MKIGVVKYNAGNIFSVQYALERLGVEVVISDVPEVLQSMDKVIFPGVGEASTAMKYLRDRNLDKVIIDLKQPVLGICLGMQLMCSHSEEGNAECLGIFDEKVKLFKSDELKIPQIGWNNIFDLKSPLMAGLDENSYVYFVHSYYVPANLNAIATTNYGIDYCSAMNKNNFYAAQFHPEKSGKVGEQILSNFINLC